jgi:chlorophyll synthase
VQYLACVKSRILVIPAYTIPTLIQLLIVSNLRPNLLDVIKVFLSVSMIAYSIYWLNDVVDLQDDLKNKELGNPNPANRPIGSNLISTNIYKFFIVINAIVGLLIGLTINFYVFIIQSFFLVLGIVYSIEPIRLKKRLLLKNTTIAIGAVLITSSGVLVHGYITPLNIYYAFMNLLVAFITPSILDLRDFKGDMAMGLKTLPVVFGPIFTARMIIGVSIAIILSTFIGYIGIGFNIALPILVTIVMSAWFYVSYPLLKNWHDPVIVEKISMKRVLPLMLIFYLTPLVALL